MGTLIITFSVVGVCVLGVVALLITSRNSDVSQRLDSLAESRISGGSLGSATGASRVSHLSRDESRSENVSERVVQAGFYKKRSVYLYHLSRGAMFVLPLLAGVAYSNMGYVTLPFGLMYGVIAAAVGTVAPSFWLDMKKKKRQMQIRRALPDALDVIIVCVEAGLSMPAAMNRVSKELRTAHPMLAGEIAICQREIQLGSSTGEALRRFSQRFDLAELRSLASVIQQAEKYGASIANALRVHADTLREKRFQRAEELAQKAVVKLVFPTILCIFPALFIVLAGPAVSRIFVMFEVMGG